MSNEDSFEVDALTVNQDWPSPRHISPKHNAPADLEDNVPPPISLHTLTIVSLPYLAIFFTAGAVVAQSFPLLLSFGASPIQITTTFVISSFVTVLLQPAVGARYDSLQIGRPKFLLSLMSCLIAGDLIYAAAAFLNRSDASQQLVLAVAFCGLFVIVVSLNTAQIPLRALTTELAAVSQQAKAHALFGLLAGVGAASAFILAATFNLLAAAEAYFVGAAALSLGTTLIAVWQHSSLQQQESPVVASDVPQPADEPCCKSMGRALRKLGKSFRDLYDAPRPVQLLYWAHFLSWAALQTFFSAVTTWCGSFLYGGKAGSAEFAKGVQIAALGQAIKSFLQAPLSAALPAMTQCFGLRRVYLLSQLCLAVTLSSMFLLPTVESGGDSVGYLAMILGASVVLPISCTQMVPFALLGQMSKESAQLGTYVAGLGTANMAGVLVAFIGMGPTAQLVGWRYVMLVAAGLAFVSAVPVSLLAFGKQVVLAPRDPSSGGTDGNVFEAVEPNAGIVSEELGTTDPEKTDLEIDDDSINQLASHSELS